MADETQIQAGAAEAPAGAPPEGDRPARGPRGGRGRGGGDNRGRGGGRDGNRRDNRGRGGPGSDDGGEELIEKLVHIIAPRREALNGLLAFHAR